MAYCSESTCWFSSLILSSLAALLLFCPEPFTSGLAWETVLIGFSWKKKNRRRKNFFCHFRSGNSRYVQHKCQMICLTILHKCSSSCFLSDFSRLPISWSDGSVSGDPASKRRSNLLCSRSRLSGETCGFCTLGFRHYEEAFVFCHSQHFDARIHDFFHRGFLWRSEMNNLLWHCNTESNSFTNYKYWSMNPSTLTFDLTHH